MINPIIYEQIKSNNNLITTRQVLELGFSKAILPKYEKEGLVKRVRQGTYILADSEHDDMYTLMLRSDHIIFSHDSALFLLGLSDRKPTEHSITIPSNTSIPKTLINECKCYYIKPELHNYGVTCAKTAFGNEVRCYNAERSICDLLRSRNRLDEETIPSCIKNYVKWEDRKLTRLAEYAVRFHVEDRIKTYLEVLL